MAEALVPPHGSCIIKCKKCKGLYVPEIIKLDYDSAHYDSCPFCGYKHNSVKNTIPVWMYNLLKFFRSGKHVDDIEAGLTKFEQSKEKKKEPKTDKANKYRYTITYFNDPFQMIQ